MKRLWLLLACVLLPTNERLWGMTADDLVQKTGDCRRARAPSRVSSKAMRS